MKTINLEDCDQVVQIFVESLQKEEVVILFKNGQPRYVLGGIDDFEWEVFSLSHNQAFLDYLEQARQRGKQEGTISIEEIRRRLDIPNERNEDVVPT